MTLSIIIPVYNAETYLKCCVGSILTQKRKPDEIILVDDGSTDKSWQICDEYAKRYDYIHAIHQENKGQSAARNKGLEIAKGEWISFLDADDWIEADMYVDLCKLAEEDQADIISSGIWVDQPNDCYSRFEFNKEKLFQWNRIEALRQLMSFRYLDMSVSNKLFKKALFQNIRFPEGKINEDLWISYRLIASASSIIHTTKPYYHYRQSDNSTTRPQSEERLQLYFNSWVRESEEQLQYMKQNFPQVVSIAKAYNAFSRIGIYNYCIRNGVNLFMETSEIRREVCRSLADIFFNRRLPSKKKSQAMFFCFLPDIYNRVIIKHDHR